MGIYLTQPELYSFKGMLISPIGGGGGGGGGSCSYYHIPDKYNSLTSVRQRKSRKGTQEFLSTLQNLKRAQSMGIWVHYICSCPQPT